MGYFSVSRAQLSPIVNQTRVKSPRAKRFSVIRAQMSPIVNQTRPKSPSEAIFRYLGANDANCEPNASQVVKRMVVRNLAEFYIIGRFFACSRLTEKYRPWIGYPELCDKM
ncbi:hypothetical protein AVEN_230337-1 [Araneus ventricosus]|uniref:Uncharacterized protein n=1 Tax=Araneus ventricosus TaxID=182803 RepID=A0A4Y2U913_ARAVE|nr:hypothetical protein AVEN_230337-1 [Araneus ventricosus]